MIERDGTRDRFLAAVAERVNPDLIAEAHLFPPIRQGGTESGVAVIAVAESPDGVVVYTAKYRLTLKGPERGKWDFAMQADADAPLVTIDKVVRGVQRRAGEEEEPIRIAGDDFRAMLPPVSSQG